MLSNTPAFAIAFYGILRRGAVAVPMNPLLKCREIEFYLSNTGAKALFAPPRSQQRPLPAPRRWVPRCWFVDDAGPRRIDRRPARQEAPVERDDTDTAVILHTSGTTASRRAPSSPTAASAATRSHCVRTLIETGPDDVVMGCLPLFHVFGLTCG